MIIDVGVSSRVSLFSPPLTPPHSPPFLYHARRFNRSRSAIPARAMRLSLRLANAIGTAFARLERERGGPATSCTPPSLLDIFHTDDYDGDGDIEIFLARLSYSVPPTPLLSGTNPSPRPAPSSSSY